MRSLFRLFVTVTIVASTLSVAAPPAHAATTLSVAVVQTNTSLNTRHYLTGAYLNGGGLYQGRVSNVVALMETEFTDVDVIGDSQLSALSELEKYDVVVFPRTLALTSAQRTAVLQYVSRGGGVVGSFGMSRWTPDTSNQFGYKPFLGLSSAPGVYQWPPSSDALKVWEWGEVSELYGLKFNNDGAMYAPWQAIGKPTSTHWILSQTARDLNRTSVTMSVKATDYCETMLTLPGATGVTPLFTYGTRSNSYTSDDAVNGTAAGVANQYYFGRFVYYGFQLHDIITTAGSTTADQQAAQRLFINSVKWAGAADSYTNMNKLVSLSGTGWTSRGILYVNPTVYNVGNVAVRGPFSIGVYTPSGAALGGYQAYAPHAAPLPPGGSYTHRSFQVSVGTRPQVGTWRVRMAYRYYDYFHGGTVEAYRDMYFTSDGAYLTLKSQGPLVRPSGALPGVGTQVAGADRYKTGVEISERGWPNGVSESGAVILATGANYPDALAASSLAGSLDAPVLLVKPNALQYDVVNELKRLYSGEETATIYVTGGQAAVPSAIVDQYRSALIAAGTSSVQIKRLEGSDRYGTALAIAREVGAVEQGAFARTAFIVSGTNYPDALAISPLAAAEGVPILPVKGTVVPPAIQTALDELGIEHCVIMGDTGVVSSTVESWLESNGHRVNGVAPGIADVDTRLGGANRYDTTLLAASFSEQMGDFDDSSIYMATGTNWPDALALAPLAGLGRHPLILINGAEIGKSSSVAGYLVDRQAAPPSVAFVGGDGAITPYVRGQVRVALGQ